MARSLIQDLAADTGLREWDIRRIMFTAPNRYKIYEIPKRKAGTRTIAQPAKEVKYVQRSFMKLVLQDLPVHDAARAYRKGYSLAANAEPHKEAGPILKMDLKAFFPSIRGEDWVRYCEEAGLFEDPDVLRLSTHLLFHRQRGTGSLRLAIGAPSSPILSNILMYEFDRLVQNAIDKDSRGNVIYTRYADDLTFSARRTGYLVHVQSLVAQVIRQIRYPKLDINPEKTTTITKRYHRAVTGLTLANDGRVTIGRARKRAISAQVHHASLGKLSDEQLKSLAGLLAFANATEPRFLEVLETKYGSDVVKKIQRHVERPKDGLERRSYRPE